MIANELVDLIDRARHAHSKAARGDAVWSLTYGRGRTGREPVEFERMATGSRWSKIQTTPRGEGWAPRYVTHASGWCCHIDVFRRAPWAAWTERLTAIPGIEAADVLALRAFVESEEK